MKTIRKISFLLLLLSIGLSSSNLRIVLESGEIIQNCQFQDISGDHLYVSDLDDTTKKIIILIDKIRLISINTDLAANKYDFAYITPEDKNMILSEIFTPQKTSEPTLASDSMTDKVNKNILIGIAISAAIIIILFIYTILVNRRINSDKDEEIKGAKEMVSTMLMWAKRHRDEASK